MRHGVILAGGSGVRFWPLSREKRPKQLLPLAGTLSLIRATYERLLPLIPSERIWVVTGKRYARQVRQELPELGRGRILAEPLARNTAPAIHHAGLAVSREDEDATLLVVPADSWVPRAGAYRRAIRSALRSAERTDRLVLVGVKPVRAETGYGYIEPGAPVGRGPAREVKRFIEKPGPGRARRLARGGRHLWNCGIFAWPCDVFADAVRSHLPALSRAFLPLEGKRPSAEVLARAYRRAPSVSVDVGILERASNISVVPAEFPWDDLGSWRALERTGKGGEFRHGSVVAIDSPGLVAWAEGGTVAVIGVPDVVVVHTADATLVVNKDRAQEVRAVVKHLKRSPEGRKLVEG